MAINELFEKIVKLEETSEEITESSLREAEEIRKHAKKNKEDLLYQLDQERKLLFQDLETQRQTEEKSLKNKNSLDLSVYTAQLNTKFEANFLQVIQNFKEKNKI